MKIILKV